MVKIIHIEDENSVKHFINVSNLNNAIFQKRDSKHFITFHMKGPHVVPLVVNNETYFHTQNQLGAFI